MKKNVDLTEQGHFSEGWMQGGFQAKGVFRKRKPMPNSKKFKKILNMGNKEKKYNISYFASKIFNISRVSEGVFLSNLTSGITSGVSLGDLTSGSWATTASNTVSDYSDSNSTF